MSDQKPQETPTPVETEHEKTEDIDVEVVQPKTQNYEDDKDLIRSEKENVLNEDEDDVRELIAILMQHPKSVRAAINRMQKDTMPGTEDQQMHYLETVEEAQRTHGATDEVISPFGRDDSDWGTFVEHEGRKIGVSRPNAASMGAGKLTKEAAVIKARAAASLGTVATIPMWGSGTWVSFKAPGDIELLYLERRMAQSKINLGRATSGLLLSATSIYFVIDIINSAFSNVFDTTAPSMSISGLKETHLITDIPYIIAGYAASIYPDGYTLVRPCVHNPNECNYIAEQESSITKLMRVDRSLLNTYQRNHMLDRRAKQTNETLSTYRKNHSYKSTDTIDLGDVVFNLSIPTIARYEDWSNRWIQSIIDHTTEAFGETLSAKQRETYLYQRAGASGLMQYGHLVKSIYYKDTDNEVTDYDTISEVLSGLSSASSFRKSFIKKSKELLSQASVSGVGIPVYNCPSCKGEPTNVHPTLKTIIQLEVAEVFFTLMLRRLQNTLRQE